MKNLLIALAFILITVSLNSCNQSKETEVSNSESPGDSSLEDISTEELERALMRTQPADSISDIEFDEFAKLYLSIQIVSDSAQSEMARIIEGEGMQLDRFNEIAESDQETTTQLTEQEQAQLKAISEKFQQVQLDQQKRAMQLLENSSMGLDRYQSILIAIQQDESLQRKLITIFERSIETH